jgi:hypothetical protein
MRVRYRPALGRTDQSQNLVIDPERLEQRDERTQRNTQETPKIGKEIKP